MALGAVIPIALASDTLSITVMEIVDNAIILIIPGAMEAGLGDIGFWAALAFALLVAGAAAYPVNRWLLARGKGHAIVHQHHAHYRVGHHHHHGHGESDSRRLAIALALIVGFMCVEVVVGILADSLALLSDAATCSPTRARSRSRWWRSGSAAPGRGRDDLRPRRQRDRGGGDQRHDPARARAAVRVRERAAADRPASGRGRRRADRRGGRRDREPRGHLDPGRANRDSLNIEGAFQHILTDLAAFIATAVAGAVILLTGYERADGIAAMFVAALMLRAAYYLLRESGRVFLEAAPRGLDPAAIGRRMAAQPGVTEVHDLHIWEVTSASRRCPPTCSSAAIATATTPAASSRRSCTTSSGSSTPPCRSTTRAASCSRSSSARGKDHPAGDRHEVGDGGGDDQRVEDLVEAERARPRVGPL